MPVDEKMKRAQRIRALRESFSLTQQQVAERGLIPRELVSKFEGGVNAATTVDTQRALARAFDVEPEIIASYLKGDLSVDDLRTQSIQMALARFRRIVRDDRYPSRARVIADPANDGRWSESAISRALSMALDADSDPGEKYWMKTLDTIDATLTAKPLPARGGSPLDDIDNVRPARKKR